MENEELIFKDSNGNEKAILGVLEGPCASFTVATRNGRKYDESLWEKVFNDPLVNELIDAGGIPGTLDHPTDSEDGDSMRIAILMKEKPKKKDGKLWAKFSILNTPCGKIAYVLAKAGFKFGISSRGSGDIITDYNGEDKVDETTYDFRAFDLVCIPACEGARLDLITESLNEKSKKNLLQESLKAELDKASEEEREVMKKTLDHLKIDYEPVKDNNIINESVDSNISAAEDNGAIVKDLQEALKDKRELENKLKELQEQLSVCHTKETKLSEELERYKSSVITLSEVSKKSKYYKAKVEALEKTLDDKTKCLERKSKLLSESLKLVKEKESEISNLKEKATKKSALLENREVKLQAIKELKDSFEKERFSLNESIKERDISLNRKDEKISTLTEKLNSLKSEHERELSVLKEGIETLKKDSAIKATEFEKRLNESKNSVNHYKKVANTAVNKYIAMQAKTMGVSSDEISKRLPENYSFNDIDYVCENLKSYQLTVSKLPFNVDKTKPVKLSIKESKGMSATKSYLDDTIDESLVNLVNSFSKK